MKISIITPVFNAVQTLEKTILSVLNQKTESEIEYIIIDGGSTDGSLEIINQHLDGISFFITESDKGVYDAMNKGIQRATGDIIGIINSDDWYNDGALAAVEKLFLNDNSLEIVYSPIDNYLDGDYFNTFIPGDLDNLIFKFTINHPSCFIKRTVYERIGNFDLGFSIAADYDFILRAYLAKAKFHCINFPLASYSLNGMSGKPMSKFKQIRESWQVGCKNLQAMPDALKRQRNKFYLGWFSKEFLLLPVKLILHPRRIRAIKQRVENSTGVVRSKQYGSW